MDKLEYVKNRLFKMKEKGQSLEKVSFESGLSRRTLTNLMNGNGVHSATIDKLHNHFKLQKRDRK